ncbi:MAG: tetratricopeptide repeat protein [Myxococcaceae bacterium]
MKRFLLCALIVTLPSVSLAADRTKGGNDSKKTTDPVSGDEVDAPQKKADASKDEQQKKDEKAAAAPEALPPPQKADPKLFDEALNDYFSNNPKKAAGKLYTYLESTSPTDENYAWAQYFLAKSFIDLGLRHAGANYLARIARERTNPNVIPKALDELQQLTQVPHDELLIDEMVFGSLDLGFLPETTANFAHYQQGLVDLKVGNERWATMHFAKLNEDSPEASHAKFSLLVTRLKDAKEKKLPEMIAEFEELSKDPKLNQDTRNEAQLAVARLKYELKDWQGALEAYHKVVLPELDPGRATLYLEEAWTRYNLGQIHEAMGLLTTLDAPTFKDEFQPDKYLLRAMIFKDLCHYLPAKRAAKELTRRFAESLEAIREREDLTEDLRLRRAAMSHGGTKRAFKFLESLELEGERLGRYAGSFGDRLYAHVSKLYDLEHAEALRIAQERLHESVRAEADRLLRASEQVRLMEYEVGLKLYERVKRGSKLVIPEEEKELEPGEVAFKFEGEYWNDELRDYRVSLKSRCIEETAQ